MLKRVDLDDFEVCGGGEVIHKTRNVVVHEVDDVAEAFAGAQVVDVRLNVRDHVQHIAHNVSGAVYACGAGIERLRKLREGERLTVDVAFDHGKQGVEVCKRLLKSGD